MKSLVLMLSLALGVATPAMAKQSPEQLCAEKVNETLTLVGAVYGADGHVKLFTPAKPTGNIITVKNGSKYAEWTASDFCADTNPDTDPGDNCGMILGVKITALVDIDPQYCQVVKVESHIEIAE